MNAILHELPTAEINELRQLLDTAVANRARVNRRIRRLRMLIQSAESGDPLPELRAMIAALREPASPPPSPSRPSSPPPALDLTPSRVRDPFAGHLGMGLGPNEHHPVQPPPSAPPMLPSVDVGQLARMSPEELDRLPFGVVTLDTRGRIIGYNDTESRLAGLPKDAVIGRYFFGEVAPCAAVREFEGRFRDFASGRSRLRLETFDFVFNFRHGAQRVLIMITPARQRGRFHVNMIRR